MVANEKSLKKLNKNLSSYLNNSQLEQVNKAYLYAANAHSGQFRSSGDPYVTHPVAVAEILAKFKMDEDCLPVQCYMMLLKIQELQNRS